MKIGFGAPVSGAWATPENLAAFATRAEQAGYASAVGLPATARSRGLRHGAGLPSVLDPMAALGFAAAGTSTDQARRRGGELPVRVARVPGQAGGHARRPVRRAARPRTRHRLDAGGVRGDRGVHGGAAARGPPSTSRCCATLWADGVSEFSGEFYSVPRGCVRAQADSARRPPGAARRAGPARAASGRAGWPTAGSPPVGPTCPGSRRASKSSARRCRCRARPGGVRIICRGVVRAGAEETGPRGERLLLSGFYEQIPGGHRVARRTRASPRSSTT